MIFNTWVAIRVLEPICRKQHACFYRPASHLHEPLESKCLEGVETRGLHWTHRIRWTKKTSFKCMR